MPLLRAPVRKGYSIPELAAALNAFLGSREAMRSRSVAEVPDPGVPDSVNRGVAYTWAKCGVPMVLRTAGRGDRKGEQFYGCPNYPRCRETGTVAGPVA